MFDKEDSKNTFEDEFQSSTTQDTTDDANFLIDDLRSLDIADRSGMTSLHLAAIRGNKDLVKYFIDSGCNVNVTNSFNTTPLLASILYNRFDIVKLLLDANAEIEVTNATGKSALRVALNAKRKVPIDVVGYFYDALRRRGLSSEQIGRKFVNAGCTLLHAVHMHDSHLTRVVLEGRESIDEQESRVAVEIAVKIGAADNVRVLLQYGPDVIQRKAAFTNVLHVNFNYFSSNLTVVKPLVARLVEWGVVDEAFVSFLRSAFGSATKPAIEMLLESRIDEHAREKFGEDLSFYLHGNCRPGIVDILRSRKISNSNARDASGRTALHLAVGKSAVDIVRYLLDEGGADPNVANEYGEAPLFDACRKNISCVELLLRHGADVQVVDGNGLTIFDDPLVRVRDKVALEPALARLAILEARGTPIKKQVRDAVNSRDKSRMIYDAMRRQIDEMKRRKVHRSFTLFNAIAMRPESIADCVRNQSALSSTLECCDDKRWHWYYASTLKMHLSRAIEIMDLRSRAAMAIYSCIDHLISSDHLVLEVIASFLTYRDLRVFA